MSIKLIQFKNIVRNRTKLVLAIFIAVILSVNCSDMEHEFGIDSVEGGNVVKGNNSEIIIDGGLFAAEVKHNMGCSDDSFVADFDYDVQISPSDSINVHWKSLENVSWVNIGTIKALLVSDSFDAGIYDLQIVSPSGNSAVFEHAVHITLDSLDTDTLDTEDTDSSGTDTLDTDTLDTEDTDLSDTDTLDTEDTDSSDTDTLDTEDTDSSDTDTLDTEDTGSSDTDSSDTDTLDTEDTDLSDTDTLDTEDTDIDSDTYPEEPQSNDCFDLWTINTESDYSIKVSWDRYSDTLTGKNDAKCIKGNKDVFLYVSTPVNSHIEIAYSSGFDNIKLRTVNLSPDCQHITCYDGLSSNRSIVFQGSDVAKWTYVTISAVNPPAGATTIINFSIY